MTHKEILEKAIRLAIDGGWNAKLNEDLDCWEPNHHAWFDGGRGERGEHVYPEDVWAELIFNHDFAKALWGDKPAPFKIWQEENIGTADYTTTERTIAYIENYRVRLIEMVLADDSIKYLGDQL